MYGAHTNFHLNELLRVFDELNIFNEQLLST